MAPENGVPENNNIWFTTKKDGIWIDPESVGPAINDQKLQALPALAGNGNLYFINHLENVENEYGIFRSALEEGEFIQPEALPGQVNSPHRDWCPYISPEEEYIIFSSHRPGGYGSGDLYISFQIEDGNWSEAVNLGEKVNTASQERFPMLSPDGRLFFFGRATADAYGDIFWMKADFIEELKEHHLGTADKVQ